jgi:hypothetical protein
MFFFCAIHANWLPSQSQMTKMLFLNPNVK